MVVRGSITTQSVHRRGRDLGREHRPYQISASASTNGTRRPATARTEGRSRTRWRGIYSTLAPCRRTSIRAFSLNGSVIPPSASRTAAWPAQDQRAAHDALADKRLPVRRRIGRTRTRASVTPRSRSTSAVAT